METGQLPLTLRQQLLAKLDAWTDRSLGPPVITGQADTATPKATYQVVRLALGFAATVTGALFLLCWLLFGTPDGRAIIFFVAGCACLFFIALYATAVAGWRREGGFYWPAGEARYDTLWWVAVISAGFVAWLGDPWWIGLMLALSALVLINMLWLFLRWAKRVAPRRPEKWGDAKFASDQSLKDMGIIDER
jgi:hypothetical protein